MGISDVALFRDSFMLQSLCAAATRKVRIGSLVTNPYVRHPAIIAAALGTLNEVSHGCAFLGIGVGAGLSALGVEQPRPVRRLEEFLQAVRELLSGAKLQADIAGPVPVVICTRSRLVSKLAGRIAGRRGGRSQGTVGDHTVALLRLGARRSNRGRSRTLRKWMSRRG